MGEGIGLWRGGGMEGILGGGIGKWRGGRNCGRRKRRSGIFCGASKLLRQSVVQEDLCLNNKPCELSLCHPD